MLAMMSCSRDGKAEAHGNHAHPEREDERHRLSLGGLMHEINNPLNYTLAAVSFAKQFRISWVPKCRRSSLISRRG